MHLATPYAWIEHLPFALWLMGAARPRTVVELGTHSGNSFFAFCQGAKYHDLDARLWAVDTWRGDAHAGYYGDDVYEDVKAYQRRHYPDNASLVRNTFDDAKTAFEPCSVDLLHIDGLHTYDAVKHDFESWKTTLSENAIVLFHDISVRRGDFGVWRLWQELSEQYATFEFAHCNGLGVLAFGKSIPSPADRLFRLAPEQAANLRSLYGRLGQSVRDWRSQSTMLARELDDIKTSRSWKIADFIARVGHLVVRNH